MLRIRRVVRLFSTEYRDERGCHTRFASTPLRLFSQLTPQAGFRRTARGVRDVQGDVQGRRDLDVPRGAGWRTPSAVLPVLVQGRRKSS
jgi:hypothetical protein